MAYQTRVLPQNFQPNWFAGCKLWLRADLGKTIGTGVSAWADISGNGLSFSQATGSAQPTVNAIDASYNDQTTLSFSAISSQFLSGTFALAQPNTCILVGENTITAAYSTWWISSDPTTFRCSATGKYELYAGGDLLSSANHSTVKGVFASTMVSATGNIYANDHANAVASGAVGGNNISGSTAFGGSSSFLTGKIAEVIFYNTGLTAAQMNVVFQYLGARYGATVS